MGETVETDKCLLALSFGVWQEREHRPNEMKCKLAKKCSKMFYTVVDRPPPDGPEGNRLRVEMVNISNRSLIRWNPV